MSQISRAMSQLEARYGMSLLRRTTHGLSLTREGEIFLVFCRSITQTLDELDELDGEFTSRARDVRGIGRVAVSANMAQHVIVPSLPLLVARHPGLTIDLLVNDALAEMSRDGIASRFVRTAPRPTRSSRSRSAATVDGFAPVPRN